ncbi:MAG: rhomboid family intramembrane serine protease [Planctomycetota bacterium]|nr:rhomboid family intramembrane serine protease [Planctomycetota bacterium]
MGIYDREYVWGSRRRARPAMWSVNTWIIIANIIVFVVDVMSRQSSLPIRAFGYFSTYKVTSQGGLEFWRFLTFQFLHADIMHIAFNMFGMYMFGPMVEAHLGRKRYLAFYLTCGIAGALFYLLLNAGGYLASQWGFRVPFLLFNDVKTPLVGASAGVFGVILACAYIAPNIVVQLLFPPIPLKLRTMAYLYVGIAAISVLFQSNNAGGEAAHLGGAAAGFVLIRRAHLLRDFFDVFTDSRKSARPPARAPDVPSRPPARRATTEEDAEVDRILAKVASQGLHSLTDAEKSLLRRATEARRSGGVA